MARPSDFGIQPSSKSSGNSPLNKGPNVEALLGSIPAARAEAGALGQQIQGVASQESPGLLQRLLSPSSLPLLAGTIGAGAFAGPAGAALFGLGGIGGLQQQVAQEQEQKAAAIENLQEQRDKALERVEKAENRFANMINTNPDILTNPITGEQSIEPEELGELLLGLENVPLFPQSRRLLNERGPRFEQAFELIKSNLENASTFEDARLLTREAFNLIQGYEVDDGTIDAIARSIGSEKGINVPLLNSLKDLDPNGVIDAFINGLQNGYDETDVRFWKFIKPTEPAVPPSEIDDLWWQQAVEKMHRFQTNPANAEKVRAIRDEAGPDLTKFQQGIADAALGDDARLANAFINKSKSVFGGMDPWVQYMQGYRVVSDKFNTPEMLSIFRDMPIFAGMSNDEFLNFKHEATNKLIGSGKRDGAKVAAKRDAGVAARVDRDLQTTMQLQAKSAAELAARIFKEANDEATSPSGEVDQVLRDRLIDEKLKAAKEAIKRDRGGE
jgi:hypothetical protein